jgi:zinc transporter, ZIP family
MPEGLSVALPLYYATGNRTKAFLIGSLSGMTEIIAALLGWAVFASVFSDNLYGAVFGIVSGMMVLMMVLISIQEVLPMAHQYDPGDKYVTAAFTSGMMVMATPSTLIAMSYS